MLEGSRIVLGVTGGIAAYKAIEVCRRLVDAGAHVTPILTNGALHFVGETTFSALASEPVQRSLWDEDSPIPHTKLGQGADLVVVCPATARVISDYRTGRSHDLLTATLIATRAPVVICPAMHTEMWEHPAVQDNLSVLAERGVHIVWPEAGRLAGGDVGTGRLADPSTVVAAVERALGPADLLGTKVVVTAGGTREAIDPVRFIGNRSSGKQGFALAAEARSRGADVVLVSTAQPPPNLGVETVMVESAAQMLDVVMAHAGSADVIVMAAAVADFRPVDISGSKLKKHDGPPQIVLEPTVDILAELGARKPSGQVLVGFAAETDDLAANARDKLVRKNADFIVGNDVSAPGVGFEHDTNAVVIYGSQMEQTVALTDKRSVARAVFDTVTAHRAGRSS
jgi:phosphopantothenoylcysteine decarboxylase / phosphopantothenate---cysteine ligase